MAELVRTDDAEGEGDSPLLRELDAQAGGVGLEELLKLADELEDALVDEGAEMFRQGSFAEAAARSATARDLNLELIEVLDGRTPAVPVTAEQREEHRKLRDGCEHLAYYHDGQHEFAAAKQRHVKGDLARAKVGYQRGEAAFARIADDGRHAYPEMMAAICKSCELAVAGQEELNDNAYASAGSKFQHARAELDKVSDDAFRQRFDDEEDLDEALGLVRLEATVLETFFHLAGVRDQVAKGNHAAALVHSEAMLAAQQPVLDGMPADAPGWVRYSHLAEREAQLGRQEELRGRLFKDEEQWDEALAAYARWRHQLQEAAAQVLKTGLPSAVGTQESLLHQASSGVDVAIRECEMERGLKLELRAVQAELDWFRDSLLTSLKGAGITVNNQAEALNEVQQRVEFAQTFEANLRGTLGDVLAMAEGSDLAPEVKRAIAERLEPVVETDDSGPGYLQRARRATEEIAALIEGAGKIAAPIGVLVKAIVGMFP